LAKQTEERVLEVLEEALAAGVICEVPGLAERYQFTHALIRQTLSGELSAARRVRLHARIGDALESLYGAAAPAHAAELAHHFGEAASASSLDKLVRYSMLAGEQALASYAHEEALGYFERALAAKEGYHPELVGEESVLDPESAALHFRLGKAQAATLPRHRLGEALDSLVHAFNYYEACNDVDGVVAVAQYFFIPPVGRHLEVVQLIQRALRLVPPDSAAAGRLLARYGMVTGLVRSGDYQTAQEAFSQALSIARRLGDTVLEMRILSSAAPVDRSHLRFEECLEKSLRTVELARRSGDLYTEVGAHRLAANILTYQGDLGPAGSHASAMLEVAERLGNHYWLVTALAASERQARLLGDWQTARELGSRGLELSPMDARLLSARVLIEYQLGNFDQGEDYLERLLKVVRLTDHAITAEYASPPMLIPLVTRITGVPARLDLARDMAREILASPAVTPLVAHVARVGLALLAVLEGDAPEAREQYAALAQEIRGTILPASTAMAADPLLALLAQTAGFPEQAVTHFEEALVFCRGAGCRPELAWTCYLYAEALLQGPLLVPGHDAGTGHAERAMSLLDEARSIAGDLHMGPLRDWAMALQSLAQSRRAVPAHPDGLTQREVEVLCLIAGGRSNLQIAERLVIAEGTARRHVSNIFTKTGVTNRAGATAYAIRHRLLELEPMTSPGTGPTRSAGRNL
jgi:DNA-binding CsgD family transcriptional regulator